jgi:hypothetical protein
MKIEVGKLVPQEIAKCFYYPSVSSDAKEIQKTNPVSWLTIIHHARGNRRVTPDSYLAIKELMRLALIRFDQPLKEMKQAEKTFKQLLK